MTEANINLKKPKFFTTPIADSGTKNDIPATGTDETVSQQLGFGSKFSTPRGSGGKSVGRADMNGLFNGVSSLNYYFQYMGRNPWVSGQSYPKGAKAWYNDAEYVSTKDDNTDTPGATGVTTWIKLNDLSGTSGGGTSVDCAWASKASMIDTLLVNTDRIPGIETSSTSSYSKIVSISGDVSTLKNSVSSLQTSVSTMSTKLDTISTKVDKNTQAKVFSLDDSLFSYFLTDSEATSSYELLFPAFITLNGAYNPNNYTASVSYNGYTYILPFPTCRIAAGATLEAIYDTSSGTAGTLSKKNAMIAYDLDSVDLSSPTQTYSHTSTTTPYTVNKTLTDDIVKGWLDISVTTPSILTISMTLPAVSQQRGRIAVFAGNVGSQGVQLFNSHYSWKEQTVTIRVLVTSSMKYLGINASRSQIMAVASTIKKYTI